MKLNLIAVSVIAATLSQSSNAFAEETIVVTANRFSQDVTEVLADIEIIERADIERLQPRSFVELMESIAGVDVIRRGGHGQTASLFVRGASSDQTLVLIDGIRVGSATLGEKAYSTISVSQIDRIEIVKGPRAAVWGSDAIGGVIQIFTRQYDNKEYQLVNTFGTNSSFSREASIGFGSDRFKHTFSYASRETDGIDARVGLDDDEDGSSSESYVLRGGYDLSANHQLEWSLQKDRVNSEFDTSFGGDKTRNDIELANIRYTTDIAGWGTSFSIANSRDESATFDQDEGFNTDRLFVTDKRILGIVTSKNLNEQLNFVGGVDWFEDDISDSATGYNEELRETTSYFAGLSYNNNIILADLVVRNDDVENVDKRTSTNAAVGYQITPNQLISLNSAEGFKPPSFNDLYFPFGGNPDLKFETSDNLELIYKANWSGVNLSATVYKTDIENLIIWLPNDDGIWMPINVGEALLQGGTFDVNFAVGDSFNHGINLSIVEPEDKQTGERLIRRSRIQASYDIAFSGENFDWSIQVNHVGSRKDSSSTLPAYTRVNAAAAYRFNDNWKLSFKINDAFDKAPIEVATYNPLGKEYFLTITRSGLF